MRNRYLWIPVVIYCAGIFGLSSLQSPPESISFIPDKLAHMFLYAGLGFLTARCLARTRGMKTLSFCIFATLFALAYGITDEIHQRFVPGRLPELGDIVADTVGGLVGALLYSAVRRHNPETGQEHTGRVNLQ